MIGREREHRTDASHCKRTEYGARETSVELHAAAPIFASREAPFEQPCSDSVRTCFSPLPYRRAGGCDASMMMLPIHGTRAPIEAAMPSERAPWLYGVSLAARLVASSPSRMSQCTSRRFGSVQLPGPDTNLARRSELGSYTADSSGNNSDYRVAKCQRYDRRDAPTRNNNNQDQCVDFYKAYDVRVVLCNGNTHRTSSALLVLQYHPLCFFVLSLLALVEGRIQVYGGA